MSQGETIHLRDLKVGSKLQQNAFDESDRLLAKAGTEITDEFVARLRDRGVRNIRLSLMRKLVKQTAADNVDDPPAVQRTPGTAELDRLVDTSAIENPKPQPKRQSKQSLAWGSLRQEVQAGQELFQDSIDRYAEIASNVAHGKRTNAKAAQGVLDQFLRMLEIDPAIGPLVMDLKSEPGEYLFHHGLNVAMAGMSVAMQVGYSPDHIIDVGLAGLFTD